MEQPVRAVLGPRIIYAGASTAPLHWFLPHRVLQDHELVYIKAGSGAVTLGAQKYLANPGSLFMLRAGVDHSLRAAPGQLLTHWFIHFRLYTENFQEVGPEVLGIPDALLIDNRQAFEETFQHFLILYGNRQAMEDDLLLKAGLLQLLAACTKREPRAVPAPAGIAAILPQEVEKAVRIMLDSVSEDLRMSELASRVGFSHYHFNTIFKQALGCSPHWYYTSLRVQMACEMLRLRHLRPTEVALRLGFSSAAHFGRIFRRHTGMSPRQYLQGAETTARAADFGL